jgi:DNA adenine methylase
MNLSAFPYPGSKVNHIDWILQYIPEHRRYIEPFCGSASLFFNKIPSEQAILNDIDHNIIHFFEVLRDSPDELIKQIELTPFSVALHERLVHSFYNGEYSQDPIARAANFFLLRWTQFGAKMEGTSGFARSGSTIRSRALSYKNSTNKLNTLSNRLMDATIECKSYDWVLNYYDHPDALFYLDPPYQGTEHRYTSKTMDHKKLLTELESIEGKFILSYDHKLEDTNFHSEYKLSKYHINKEQQNVHREYLYMNYNPNQVVSHQNKNQTRITSEAWS